MKPIKFLGKILGNFRQRRFSMGLILLANELPDWLFKYNAAWLMINREYKFPESLNPEISVKNADESDVDVISRIGAREPDEILSQLEAGAICFISSKDGLPSAISWSACGKIFVRGLGFLYDIPEGGFYNYGAYTINEARHQGHYLVLESALVRYESSRGNNTLYAIIELANEYIYPKVLRLGYVPEHKVFYLKLFFMKFCFIYNIITGGISVRMFFKEPTSNAIVI